MPTYEELLEENRRMSERIAYLERMLYGSKRDKRRQTLNEGPGLFDDEFNEALDEKQADIEQTAVEIRPRRKSAASSQSKRPPARPSINTPVLKNGNPRFIPKVSTSNNMMLSAVM